MTYLSHYLKKFLVLITSVKEITLTHIFALNIIALIVLSVTIKDNGSQYIFETGDQYKIPLLVKTDSEYSYKELHDIFKQSTIEGLNELSKNEERLNEAFKCSFIEIDEYTFDIASSFDTNVNDSLSVYSPKYDEFTNYDEYIMSKLFIKNNKLEASYLQFVDKLTENGDSKNRATALWKLKKDYE